MLCGMATCPAIKGPAGIHEYSDDIYTANYTYQTLSPGQGSLLG